MKKNILPFLFSGSFILAAGLFSCSSDQLPEPTLPASCMDSIPTYDGSVKAVIDSSCAYSGCHLDGSAPGVYTDYEGLRSVIENGRFREKVIDLRDDPNLGMPPDFAPPGRPKNLGQEDFELIQCWLENGYPEK